GIPAADVPRHRRPNQRQVTVCSQRFRHGPSLGQALGGLKPKTKRLAKRSIGFPSLKRSVKSAPRSWDE
ncbi:MAG: hypothetical protein OXS32_00155, partial [Verrucomicrobiales bacterium]|nr:hypothetical protein [Verrucomicrobiales bacterium]